MDQESPPALEPNNQILAATLDRRDPLALELGRHLGSGSNGRVSRGSRISTCSNRRPDEHRLELRADGLDLGQLGHGASLARRRHCGAASTASAQSRTMRRGSGGVVAELVGGRDLARRPRAADASSRAWTSASGSPGRDRGRRACARQTTPTAWSIVSSFVRRPAPRWRAATPTATRAEPRDDAASRAAATSRTTGAVGSAASSRVAALGADPALVRGERRAVGDGRLGAPAALGLVDAEVGEREQVRARRRARAR